MADLMIHQLTTERLPGQVIGNEWIAIDVIDPTQPLGYKTMKIKISSLPQGGGGGNTYELIDNGDNTFQLVENGVPILPAINKGGGGGGATLFYSVTKAQLDTLISSNTLVEGATYWINDRGDVGLFFKAVSTNWLDFENGYRIMRVPIDYNVISVGANTMHGIWQNTLSVVAGDYVIWGGKVWQNLNGNIGAENDQFTLDSEWQLVPKTDNNVYKNFGLGCTYDYDNDWIAYCWDKRDNKLGLNYLIAQDFGFSESVTNFSDWANFNSFIENNECQYIVNNICDVILSNRLSVLDSIYSNVIDKIMYNTNNGSIFSNYGGSEIHYNSNYGSISNNSSSVERNSNKGDISSNSNTGGISENSNAGAISSNQSNVTDIKNNSNNGTIDNNNNSGSIENNANDGFISSNENVGNIEKNINNGTILGNRSLVTNIYRNINNGDINNNDNAGNIQMNSNNGAIVNASNSVLTIENNTNNGIIDGTSLSGNITDTVVNKI